MMDQAVNGEGSTLRRAGIAVLTLVTVAAAVYALLTKPWEPEGTRLTADFSGAGQGLTTTSPVRMRGVTIGQVAEIGLRRDGRARVTLRIDEGVKVPRTATASLEPESVFGPQFINLVPGKGESVGPYLAARGHIASTAEAGDLNGLLQNADRTLAAIDPGDVAIIVGTLAQGLGGQGETLGEIIDSTDEIVEVGHRNRERARRFTADLARLAEIRGMGASIAALAGDGGAVIDTAASGENRLKRLAAETGELSRTVAGGLDRHGGQLAEGARSAERAAGLVYDQLGIAGTSVRAMTDLLPIYRAITWPVAPDGERRMIAVKIYFPPDPCELIVGLCPADRGAGGSGSGLTGGR